MIQKHIAPNKTIEFSDPREFALMSYLSIRSLAREVQEVDKQYVINAMKRIRSFSYNPSLVQQAVNDIRLRLERKRAELLSSTNSFSLPDPKILKGNIYVGNTVGSNLPVFLPLRRINENIGIWGRLGGGKTNLCILIFLQLNMLGIPVRAYDYKDEYRNLSPYVKDMVALNSKFDKLAPLEPVEDPKDQIQFVGDTLQQDFNIKPETKFMLVNYMDELYKIYGVYERSKNYPSILNLRDFLLEEINKPSISSSKKRKIHTCLEVFEALIKCTGDMLNCSTGYTEERLANFMFVSYEMSGLSSNVQSWLTKLRLKHLHHRCFQDKERNKLKMVGLLEEVKMFFSENMHQSTTAVDYGKQIYTQGRSSGTGVIVTDQNKEGLADFVVNNLSCQFCFSLASPHEIRPMAFSLGCNEEQVKRFHNLKIPYAVMSLAGYLPFMIKIPRMPVAKQLSDDELVAIMKPRLENLTITPTPQSERLKIKANFGFTHEPKTKTLAEFLKETKTFLEQVENNPQLNISQLYNSLKISGRRGDNLKQSLIDNGIIEESIIRTGERKRPSKNLKLTTKGKKVLIWIGKKVKAA